MPPSEPSRSSSAYHHGDLRRALVEAAVALVREEQAWDFSLREVARRAQVSHSAPYNHFADKRDLLAAVAAAGYEALRLRLVEAAGPAQGAPRQALEALGLAYVDFGLRNPAQYRLMFGPALVLPGEGLPAAVLEAAASAKAVLGAAVEEAARRGLLGFGPEDRDAVEAMVLATWSLVHGLTMLAIDGMAGSGGPGEASEAMARRVIRAFLPPAGPARGA